MAELLTTPVGEIFPVESENHGTGRYPALYQINTRVWLTELSRACAADTLDDIPDADLDRLAAMGLTGSGS